jgi:hypothetical protein
MKLGWVRFINHSCIFWIAVRVESDLQVSQPLFEIRYGFFCFADDFTSKLRLEMTKDLHSLMFYLRSY